MQELTMEEIDEVNGGIVPIIAYAAGVLFGAAVVGAGYIVAVKLK